MKKKKCDQPYFDDLKHDFDDFHESNEEQIMVSFFEKSVYSCKMFSKAEHRKYVQSF